jgi:hypothetical protein
MAKLTKANKLAFVEAQEKYCELIQNVITEIEKSIKAKKNLSTNTVISLEIAKLELELFQQNRNLAINKIIAEDFRYDYENIFLQEYEKRIEVCYKYFDEYFEIAKINVDKIPKTNLLYTAISTYEQENPNNESEELMLLMFEKISPFVEMIKAGKK